MNYSICIPTIYKSISRTDLFEFMNDNIGAVSRIDCIDLNQHNRRVFVHFSEWYSNKGYAQILQYQLEKKGSFEIYIPNTKNKNNPIFHATILINKNPLSNTDFQIKQLRKFIGNYAQTTHYLNKKILVLESKVLLMEDALKKLYGSYYGIDMQDDMNMDPMISNELNC